MRRRLFIVLALLLVLGNFGAASASTMARDVLQGDQCVIAADDHLEGNVFVLCRTLVVSGVIDGSLFGGASDIQIDGTVLGSLYLVGAQLNVTGEVGGDIHFAGGVIDLQPSAHLSDPHADLISLSLNTLIENTHVPGSVTTVGYQLLIDGTVGREVSFWGSALTIDSMVGGDVTATVGDPSSTGVTELRTLFDFLPVDIALVSPGLRVGADGMIDGTLRYSGPVEGDIAARLPNPPEFTPVLAQTDFNLSTQVSFLDRLRDYAAQVVREFVSLVLVGVIGLLVMPRTLQAPIYSLRVRPLPSLGVGLLTFIISFPIFLIVILLSVALMLLLSLLRLGDLALIGGLIVNIVNVGAAGLFFFTAIFISRVIVSIALGRLTVRLLLGDRPERYMTYVSLLIGVVLVALAASLPYVGWIFNALAAFFGLGATLMLIQRQLDAARHAARPEPTYPEEARQLPPPLIEDTPRAPGMENLPEGFHWWR